MVLEWLEEWYKSHAYVLKDSRYNDIRKETVGMQKSKDSNIIQTIENSWKPFDV